MKINEEVSVLSATSKLAVAAARFLSDIDCALGLITGQYQDLRYILRFARLGKLQLPIDVIPIKQFGELLCRAASRLKLSFHRCADCLHV